MREASSPTQATAGIPGSSTTAPSAGRSAAGSAGSPSAAGGGVAGELGPAGNRAAANGGSAAPLAGANAAAGVGGTAGSTRAGNSGAPAGQGSAGQAGVPAAGAAAVSGKHPVVPSTGCGKAGRPSGGLVTVSGSHIYSFPPSYDGMTLKPLIMAFHAAGNNNDQLRNITKGSPLEAHFVMAFPKSKGNGWALDADSATIDARYQELLANYCIDTSRVFATGHSSGAQLIVQFMCRNDTRYFAIAPVASSAYCQHWNKAIPALVIHGANDHERANTNQDADGTKDLAPYLSSNKCSANTQPHEQAGCSSGGTQVEPGCVDYQGCAEPTIWCHHNDPQYSGTNHGWPCFANLAIDAFFTSLL
jgi:hypothetical protein